MRPRSSILFALLLALLAWCEWWIISRGDRGREFGRGVDVAPVRTSASPTLRGRLPEDTRPASPTHRVHEQRVSASDARRAASDRRAHAAGTSPFWRAILRSLQPPKDGESLVARWIRALDSADAGAREEAVAGLLSLGPAGLPTPASTASFREQRAWAKEVARARSPRLALLKGLAHPNANVRAAIVGLLPQLVESADEVLPVVVDSLRTQDWGLWFTATQALAAVGGRDGNRREVLTHLLDAIDGPVPGLRVMALKAWAREVEGPDARAEVLVALLGHQDVRVRRTATDLLGACARSSPACRAGLELAARDTDDGVHGIATEWLAQLER